MDTADGDVEEEDTRECSYKGVWVFLVQKPDSDFLLVFDNVVAA